MLNPGGGGLLGNGDAAGRVFDLAVVRLFWPSEWNLTRSIEGGA